MSIRHIVLFHLAEGLTGRDPRVVAACAAEKQLTTLIPGDHGWTFGRDLSRRRVSADFAGTGDFASRAALDAFLAHPAHLSAAEQWAPLATWWVADVEIEP